MTQFEIVLLIFAISIGYLLGYFLGWICYLFYCFIIDIIDE